MIPKNKFPNKHGDTHTFSAAVTALEVTRKGISNPRVLDVRDSHKMYQKILTTFWCENNVAKNAMKMHLLHGLFCVTLFSSSKNIRAISRKSWPLNHSQKDFVQDNGLRQCGPSWHQKWWNLFLSKIKLVHQTQFLLLSSTHLVFFQLWRSFYGEGFTNKFKPWLSSNVTWKLGNEFSIEEEVSFVMPQIWYTELPRVEKFLFFSRCHNSLLHYT